MTTSYDHAFKIIIGHEGGYGADPRDRGNWTTGIIGKGELKGTKYGIASHAYPRLDIKNLTLTDAKAIYKRDYWDRIGADSLPAPLALAAFDTAVNSGVGRAREFLAKTRDWQEFLSIRLAFLRRLATWPTFGRGWQKRVDTLRAQCADLERQATPPVPITPPQDRVFITDGGGKRALWDGKPVKYAGIVMSKAWVAALRIVCPPGLTCVIGGLTAEAATDGALILSRTPAAPVVITAQSVVIETPHLTVDTETAQPL